MSPASSWIVFPTLDVPDSGAYQLFMELPRDAILPVGALGRLEFPAGGYIYTGRAGRNLRARIDRHVRKEKRLRWHIDYFLQWAQIIDIRVFPNEAEGECGINLRAMEELGGTFPVKGFGASDCSCRSHLLKVTIDTIRLTTGGR